MRYSGIPVEITAGRRSTVYARRTRRAPGAATKSKTRSKRPLTRKQKLRKVGKWFLITCLVGVLPFSALGLWLGTLVGGRGAPALINLVYLPMAFLSGLFLPLSMLPSAFRALAPLWPSYHLARIAQAQVGYGDGAVPWRETLVLLGVTVLFLFLARRRLATP